MKIDLLSPEFIENPYPTYTKLREQAPVFSLESGSWLITRHSDVDFLLKDSLLNKDVPSVINRAYGRDMGDEPFFRINNIFWASMASDRRKIIVKALNTNKINEIRGRVKKSAEQLVDKWIECGNADLKTVFAYPFPVLVICNILSIELDNELDFLYEAKLISRAIEPSPLSSEELEITNAASLRLSNFFAKICQQRRDQPGEDVISQLLLGEEGGERLAEDEIIANLIILFVAGYGTTANSLCIILRLLFLYPEQRALLLNKPELLPRAVEEGLRFSPSAPITFRSAITSFELHGVQIAVGDNIYLALDSANHDPDAFVDPDRFWIERPPTDKRSLAFGQGKHFCLGARLVSLALEVALETLIERLPDLNIDTDQLKWEKTWVFKGLESLPASW
jgi:cytochrome P450